AKPVLMRAAQVPGCRRVIWAKRRNAAYRKKNICFASTIVPLSAMTDRSVLMTKLAIDPAAFMQRQVGYLPGELGIEMLEIKPGFVKSRLKVTKRLMAPNGFLHAASVIALADSSAGYGCIAALPEG